MPWCPHLPQGGWEALLGGHDTRTMPTDPEQCDRSSLKMDNRKRLAYAIIQFLHGQLQHGGLSPDAQESLEGKCGMLSCQPHQGPGHPSPSTTEGGASLLACWPGHLLPSLAHDGGGRGPTPRRGPACPCWSSLAVG